MKKGILLMGMVCFISINLSLFAQTSVRFSGEKFGNIVNDNPFYDYSKQQLSSVDTIPGFELKQNKLKIYGTIYKSDGVTPAKDVILYIEQADENGNFDLREENGKQYLHNRGWVKTDINGNYTFYTFIPGNDRRFNVLKQLFPVIKEPSKKEYEIATFLFDDDPLLSKSCRKRIAKKSDITRILKLEKEDGLFVTQKHIILQEGLAMVD